jgi:hypothetical protein
MAQEKVRVLDAGEKLKITKNNETIMFIDKEGALAQSDNEFIQILNGEGGLEYQEFYYNFAEPTWNSIRELVDAINGLIGIIPPAPGSGISTLVKKAGEVIMSIRAVVLIGEARCSLLD